MHEVALLLLLLAGKSYVALQHTAIVPGGFMMEDAFLLVEAKRDLGKEALVQAPPAITCVNGAVT